MAKNSLGFNIVLGLLFLLPIFFIPVSTIPLEVAKVILAALGVIVLFLISSTRIMKEGKVSFPGHLLISSVVLIPLVYLVSALMSSSAAASLFGSALGLGTFGFMLIASVLMGLLAITLENRQEVFKAYGALLLSFLILAIFSIVKILTGGKFLSTTFNGSLTNPIGIWTDAAMAFGLIATISLFAIELLPLKKMLRAVFYVLLGVSALVLMIANFSIAWILVLVSSLVAFVYFMVTEKSEVEGGNSVRKLSKLSLTMFIVALVFVINPTVSPNNGSLGNTVSNVFKVQNVDIRPTFKSTIGVASQVLKENALLGSGPNTFDRDWLKHKPSGVNSTTFWNVAFLYGFGFLPTQVASVGIIGSLLWVAFLIFFIWLGARAIFKPALSKSDRFLVMSSFMGALFIWISTILYTPSSTMMLLGFALTGIFLAVSAITGLIPWKTVVFSTNTAKNFLAVILVVALGIGAVAFGFLSYEKVASAVYFNKAASMVQSGASLESVEAELAKAANLSPEDAYYRALTDVNFTQAQAAINDTKLSADAQRQAFQTAIAKAIAAAQAATKVEPGNYLNWMKLGAVYEALVPAPLAVQGAYESARDAYAEAMKLNPTSPEIPLIMARLEIEHKNNTEARKYINQSLSLKQDYADAYYLLTQLEVSDNNLTQAIKSAETLAILTPTNAGIFFELGLLKYNAADYTGAAQALQQALQIFPDYANAKYFLGLAADKLGEKEAALQIFKDLLRTNPDNAELPKIIANLEAGKPALDKIAPATDAKTTPPLPESTTKAQ